MNIPSIGDLADGGNCVTVKSVSVIVEWYNMTYAELERPRRMLAALAEQAISLYSQNAVTSSGLSNPLELIIAYNSNRVSESRIHELLAEFLSQTPAMIVKTLPFPGGTYCQMKNAGACASSGEILLFLDSDVVPEPGWLQAFLHAFGDNRVLVGVGNTFVDSSDGSVYSKAMALGWGMFPLRSQEDCLRPLEMFYSNNMGFRRDVFLTRQFPDCTGLTHYPATLLVQRLQTDGIDIWQVTGARVSHPAPNGFKHFLARAIAAGRAHIFTSPDDAFKCLLDDIIRILYLMKQVLANREKVGLSWWQVPQGVLIAFTYHVFEFGGRVATLAAPGLMRRRFIL
jgi:GT2 family glycosyltransferase